MPMPHSELEVVGITFTHGCSNSSPRYMRENHYAVLVIFENFSGFQLQDKHNASSNSKILEGVSSLQMQKYEKCRKRNNISYIFFMLAHKYL